MDKVGLFSNGFYQFLVGLSCAEANGFEKEQIISFGYDIGTNRAMKRYIQWYAESQGVLYKYLSFEVKKSKAHPIIGIIKSLINELNFSVFSKLTNCDVLFLPHLYFSPEVAVVNSCITKRIFIYDDGLSMYQDIELNGISPINGSEKLHKRVLSSHLFEKITIHPSQPSLFNIQLLPYCQKKDLDYTRIFLRHILNVGEGIKEHTFIKGFHWQSP